MISKLQGSFRQITSKNMRFFHFHEYQSKDLMHKFNVRAQYGIVAQNSEEAYVAAKNLDHHNGLIIKVTLNSQA